MFLLPTSTRPTWTLGSAIRRSLAPARWRALLRRVSGVPRIRDFIGLAVERAFDARLGVRTAGIAGLPPAVAGHPSFSAASDYHGAPARRLAGLVRALPVTPSQTTFVDLGCGKGKALLVAAELGFARVVGVELVPEFAEIARINVRRRRHGGNSQIEVVCQDAADFVLPDEPLLVFLYHPFGGAVLRRVVGNIEESLVHHPRPLHVLYLDPAEAHLLEASCRLQRLRLPDHVARPRSPSALKRYERGYRREAWAFAHSAAAQGADEPAP